MDFTYKFVYSCICIAARRDMEKMADLRYEIGDMNEALETLHMDPNNSAVGKNVSFLILNNNI